MTKANTARLLLGLSCVGFVAGVLAVGYAASVFITHGATLALLPALPKVLTASTTIFISLLLVFGLALSAASGYGIYTQGKKVQQTVQLKGSINDSGIYLGLQG